MPKIVKTPKTRQEIQQASNARLGVKVKSFSLKLDLIHDIETLAKDKGMSQAQIIRLAIDCLKTNG